jgi:3-methyladenine DNA glycosylase AlkC
MEPFKNLFSAELVRCTAHHLRRHIKQFDPRSFEASVLRQLDALELKARAQLIADHVHAALPTDPAQRERILLAMLHPDDLEHANQPASDEGMCGWGILPLAQVVAQHGLQDFDRSMRLLREMTKRFTAEYAVRPFLLADQSRAINILGTWVDDPNHHVRRLVSEGSRPRLPWAMQLPELKRDPSPMLPLLERLRDDASPYVRRSVANHLNDISKDHPELITTLAASWRRSASKEREALLRHACRGLIKQGHAAALAVFDRHPPKLKKGPLQLSPPSVRMGEVLEIQMTLRSTAQVPQQLTVDYVLHFLKANGQRSPKVFKGALLTLAPGESITFCRSHRFREVTTRKHYPGEQGVCLRINGVDTEVVGVWVGCLNNPAPS